MRAEIRNTTRRTTLRLLLSWRKCTTNIRPRNFCDLLMQLAFPTFSIYDTFATDVNFTTCWCNRPPIRIRGIMESQPHIYSLILNINKSFLNINKSFLNIKKSFLNIKKSFLNIKNSFFNIKNSFFNIKKVYF